MDSSVWIDFFSQKPGPAGAEMRRLVQSSAPLAVSGIIVSEVLQGIRRDAAAIEKYLDLFRIIEPVGIRTYKRAAAIHRTARARGFSIHTVDAILAAIAIDHDADFFTLDRDFEAISRFSELTLYRFRAKPFVV